MTHKTRDPRPKTGCKTIADSESSRTLITNLEFRGLFRSRKFDLAVDRLLENPEDIVPVAAILKSKNQSLSAVWTLERVAARGMDISAALPSLVDALSYYGVEVVRLAAARTLQLAIQHQKSRDKTIAVLVDTLKDENPLLKGYTSDLLKNAAKSGDKEARNAITIAVNALIHSEWLDKQSRVNSVIFEEVITHCTEIMKAAQNAEANEVSES